MNKDHAIFPILLLCYSVYLKYCDSIWFSVFVFAAAMFCWMIIITNHKKGM